MADTESPEKQGNSQKEKTSEGRKPSEYSRQAGSVVLFEDSYNRVVRNTSEGNDHGEKFPKSFFVNRNGVLGGLNTSVGEDIHDLKRFNGPEREGCLKDKKSKKEGYAAYDGGSKQQDFSNIPGNSKGI